MILNERHAVNFVNKDNYPFFLSGILFCITALSMVLVKFLRGNLENVWMVGGTELLLYLLANAISGLIVVKLGRYLKRTFIAYILNLGFILSFIFILFGKKGFAYTDIFPIYSALIFSFFISIGLIIIIRKVLEVLKE